MSNYDRDVLSFPSRLQKIFSIPPIERTDSELAEIMHATSEINFFKKITEERNTDRVHWECCRAMMLEIVKKDENVINFGETGDKFYIVLKGTLRVLLPLKIRRPEKTFTGREFARKLTIYEPPKEEYKNPGIQRTNTISDFDVLPTVQVQEYQESRILHSGDSFGELALLNSNPRSATIRCLETCFLAILTRRDYKIILRSDAEKAVKDRVEMIRNIPVFHGINLMSLKCLGYFMTESTFKKNQIVYSENAPIDSIYIIRSGEFKLTIRDVLDVPKNYNSKSLLRLKMMKNQTKKVDLEIVVKGKNQIFGHEEFVLGLEKRKNSCTCISIYGKVFVASLNDLKIRPGCSEILSALKGMHLEEDIKSNCRLKSLRSIEKMKMNHCKKIENVAGLSGIHEVLHQMGKRHRPAFVVVDKAAEIESNPLSERKKRFSESMPRNSLKTFDSAKTDRGKEMVRVSDGFLKNILKKSGIGTGFKDDFKEIFLGNKTCKARKSLSLVE